MGSDVDSIELAVDPASAAAARDFTRTMLSASGVPEEVTIDLVLATSELVTNAIEHGDGEQVGVTVRVDDSGPEWVATVTVSSMTDAALSDPVSWSIAPPDSASGRGLGIVRAVADTVTIERATDGSPSTESSEVSITVSRRWG